MPNLSWLFYKGYYDDFRYWLSKKNENEKAIEAFFQTKNKLICAAEIPEFEMMEEEGCHGFQLTTTYPGLLIGAGYAHETGKIGELKLGFQFDHTYGMPVLSGSSVKGVIRSAFPQFKTEKGKPWIIDRNDTDMSIKKGKAKYIGNQLLKWAEEGDELYTKVHRLEQHIFEGLNIEQPKNEEKSVYYSLYQRDIFYDAFPVKGIGENGKKMLGTDAITPHGTNPLKNPTPLPFIKILPGVSINFVFKTNAPVCFNLTWDNRIKLYHDILAEFGAGAKTNVGYGQFQKSVYKTKDEKIRDDIDYLFHHGLSYPIKALKLIKIKSPNNT